MKTENTPKERKKYFIKIKSINNVCDSERSEEILKVKRYGDDFQEVYFDN